MALAAIMHALSLCALSMSTRCTLPRARAVATATAAASSLRTSENQLCLIDGHALAYRMHFALLKTGMSTSDGRPSHALHGFLLKLLDMHERYPGRMLVCFALPLVVLLTLPALRVLLLLLAGLPLLDRPRRRFCRGTADGDGLMRHRAPQRLASS